MCSRVKSEIKTAECLHLITTLLGISWNPLVCSELASTPDKHSHVPAEAFATPNAARGEKGRGVESCLGSLAAADCVRGKAQQHSFASLVSAGPLVSPTLLCNVPLVLLVPPPEPCQACQFWQYQQAGPVRTQENRFQHDVQLSACF